MINLLKKSAKAFRKRSIFDFPALLSTLHSSSTLFSDIIDIIYVFKINDCNALLLEYSYSFFIISRNNIDWLYLQIKALMLMTA